ncbi:putative ABC exporter domain-containing protein [Solilutibacter silvestris]|uniref:Uncharacterized protein n=1 Tax=Solilutibacter silvestris TaxID=1645665 RepID=A0A2K1Q1R2_9GAMM|nr:putative ABC exporter domain-containing protein [Lysobacter silvestris]PNS08971.1 hypothetical protein Lysil_0600 [Lysobacter silvestris]
MIRGNRFGTVVGAFVYLQAMSLYNNVRQRVLRLRQPKYLFGAVVGAAYLYFFLFRKVVHVGDASGAARMSPEVLASFASAAALALALYVFLEWILSRESVRLGFSEAEIDFLFPAPLTRTSLIHFGLLRSQLGIFFSSFLIGLLLRRGGGFSGHPLQFATGMWLLMSTLKLHSLAASFTCERLIGFGVRPWLRRFVVTCVFAAIALACWWPLREMQPPVLGSRADIARLQPWFEGIVNTAPLSWLLMPFRWMIAPIFAGDGASFLRALLPALALLVVNYLWVVRAQVSFEDAAIVHARRRAEVVAAKRDGRLGVRKPGKPRSEPFRLSGHGEPALAFLWKGLVEMGPLYRPRTWLIAAVVVIALCQWLAADPARKSVLVALGIAVPMLGGWLVFLGPMMVQKGLRRTFERLDVLKSMPLRGWQIALGELSTPATVMCSAFWLLLLFGAQALASRYAEFGLSQVIATAVGAALLSPPLFGLMLCVPFAGMLYFPAWTLGPDNGGRGFDVMGQRMIFMFGYLLTVLLVAIPAALLGGIAYLFGHWVSGFALGVVLAAICGGIVFALELAFALRLLGRRIDRFDLSQELR